MDLTLEEYVNYINSLRKLYEIELLYKCLMLNKSTFLIPEEKIIKKKHSISLKMQKAASIRRQFSNISMDMQDFIYDLDDYEKETSQINIHYLDYIDKLTPKVSLDDSSERKPAKIFKYIHVVSLKAGDTFGDIALSNSNQKRLFFYNPGLPL